jgi:hypothetical protein
VAALGWALGGLIAVVAFRAAVSYGSEAAALRAAVTVKVFGRGRPGQSRSRCAERKSGMTRPGRRRSTGSTSTWRRGAEWRSSDRPAPGSPPSLPCCSGSPT